jgi:hypothetical protein
VIYKDVSLDNLLLLDGEMFVIDPGAGHWVKFVVKRVPASKERPQGLSYSLTLHAASGERLIGFDNAHPIRGKRSRHEINDHKHRHHTVLPYEYLDAEQLLVDFWAAVEAMLKERGVDYGKKP